MQLCICWIQANTFELPCAATKQCFFQMSWKEINGISYNHYGQQIIQKPPRKGVCSEPVSSKQLINNLELSEKCNHDWITEKMDKNEPYALQRHHNNNSPSNGRSKLAIFNLVFSLWMRTLIVTLWHLDFWFMLAICIFEEFVMKPFCFVES